MLSSRLVRLARLDRLGPDPTVSDRALGLACTARLLDEVTSGSWDVLTPVFRRQFGLSLVQVGLLTQVLTWVALVVEPVTASLIDVASRRRLMAFGAGAIALSMLVMGASPVYGALVIAFALFGVGSGPLAHTADVVVVESFPVSPERAYTRTTFLDTVGAMAGPALVAAAAALGWSWRVVLLGLGGACACYAVTAARTPFPPPPGTRSSGWGIIADAIAGMRTAMRRRSVRRAVLVLLCFDVFEAAFVLEYIWLHESVGVSEAVVAVWAAAAQVVDLVALVLLDRWLQSASASRLLRLAALALTVLPAAWVAAPGVWGRVVIGVPLAFAHALVWPLAKARSLVAAPELAGAVQAITTLFPVIPLALLESWFAEAVGVGPAMAATAAIGAAAMLVVAERDLPVSEGDDR